MAEAWGNLVLERKGIKNLIRNISNFSTFIIKNKFMGLKNVENACRAKANVINALGTD